MPGTRPADGTAPPVPRGAVDARVGTHNEGPMSRDGAGEATSRVLERVRTASMVVLLSGAMGSVALMLVVGRRNSSRLLLVVFAVWVLSPFAVLAAANMVSKTWSALSRTTLYGVMLVLTPGSLAVYGNIAFGHPRPQPAFAFVIVPPASFLLIAVALSIAAWTSGRRSGRTESV